MTLTLTSEDLRSHQKEGISFLIEKENHGCLFYEQRLGKTLIMLLHLAAIRNRLNKEPFPALIVCPLSAVNVWPMEIEKFGFSFDSKILSGDSRKKRKLLMEEPVKDIYIINYEGFRILGEDIKKFGFKTIIFDESHRIQHISSQQTTLALQLAKTIPNRFILTGTPYGNSPEGIWSQIQFVKPGHLGNFFSFQAKYVEYKEIDLKKLDRWGRPIKIRKAVRNKNLAELQELLKEVSIRKTRAECYDMPLKNYISLPCEMEGDQLKSYLALKLNLKATLLDQEGKDVLGSVKIIGGINDKLRQVCSGFIYDDDHNAHYFSSNCKLSYLKDYLLDCGDRKLIIFTYYVAETQMLKEALQADYNLILFDGSPEERGQKIKQFQESKEPCIFISNIERAKEGINLSSGKDIIYYSNTPKYISRVQSEDRIINVESNEGVNIIDIVCKGKIDEIMTSTLKRHGATADVILEDSKRLARMVLENND
jgi:SNF2 family DNA or RNA helicase